MTTENGPQGATPSSGPDPAAGAMPGGQQTSEGATPSEQQAQGATPDAQLGESGQAALDKERDARRDAERRATEARRRIAELEDAGKSDTERLAAQLKRAQTEVDEHRTRVTDLEREIARRDLDALKLQVASEASLPPSAAHRLHGDDLRTLRKDAEALAKELGVGAGQPVGSFGIGRGGNSSGSRGREPDMNSLIRGAAGRE